MSKATEAQDEIQADLQSLITEYIELDQERRDTEAKLAGIKEQQSRLAEPLAEQMAATGTQRITQGGLTLYLKRNRYASKKAGVSQDEVCEVLKALELDYMVSEGYSASSLKSWIIERLDGGDSVPEALENLINVGEQVVPATRVA